LRGAGQRPALGFQGICSPEIKAQLRRDFRRIPLDKEAAAFYLGGFQEGKIVLSGAKFFPPTQPSLTHVRDSVKQKKREGRKKSIW